MGDPIFQIQLQLMRHGRGASGFYRERRRTCLRQNIAPGGRTHSVKRFKGRDATQYPPRRASLRLDFWLPVGPRRLSTHNQLWALSWKWYVTESMNAAWHLASSLSPSNARILLRAQRSLAGRSGSLAVQLFLVAACSQY